MVVQSKNTPTLTAYSEMQRAYDFFNKELFKGELPHCIITMVQGKKFKGYFCSERFRSINKDTTSEIAMNPDYLISRPIEQSLSTLGHEMVHLWQYAFGKPSKRAYHNIEWANKMEEIGLMPTDTGLPGGHKTGEKVTHFIIEGGDFEKAVKKLIGTGFKITWGSNPQPTVKKNKSNRIKYVCPECEAAAWGKPDLMINCGVCELEMEGEIP